MQKLRQAFVSGIRQDLDLPESLLEVLLAALLCKEHVLLEGPPGSGKSTLARCIGELTGSDMGRIQMNPDITPSDILGCEVLVSSSPLQLEFREGPVFKAFLLIDEINRAMPRVQSALLQAMAERQVEVAGQNRDLHPDFWLVATQNPYDMDGTFLLPMSQWDRFGLALEMPLPQGELLERQLKFMLGREQKNSTVVDQTSSKATQESRLAKQKFFRDLLKMASRKSPAIDSDWFRVIRGLQEHLTQNRDRGMGTRPLSLRAWTSWLNLGSCLSLLRGKDYLSTECLRELLLPALLHRCSESRDRELGLQLLAAFDRLSGLKQG